MKKFSKILSVALLVALVFSLGITNAFAANPTLKVTDPVNGHKYSYFQLFTGDVSADGKKLSNVKWGADVASTIKYMGRATEDATELSELTINNPSGDVPQAVLDYLAMRKVAKAQIYDMKYVGLLSLAIVVVCLLSSFLYEFVVIRYAIVAVLLVLAVVFRKKLIGLIKNIRGKKNEA